MLTQTVSLLVVAAALAAPLRAQDSVARPAPAPAARVLDIRRATGPIALDARLDDAGWADAARITAFVEYVPREGAAPPVATEAMVTYDDKNLYIAIAAKDPNPREIRATLQPRDLLWSDDWIGVLVDPFGDGSLGYYFLSNAIGVQGDLQMTPQSEDGSIDYVFHTAGKITADGFNVEMAIPFRSLRFPNRPVQEWKIMLVRTYPRSSRHYLSWPSLSQNNNCQLCQAAELRGLQGVRAGGGLEMIPSVIASRAGSLSDADDPTSYRTGDPTADASLTVRYGFQSGQTVEAALNPDFSQVEADAAQVDVNTTFALFYPERRPFFQEGTDLYDTPLNVFYSRSINSPEVATKLTSRNGRTRVGYIGAMDEQTPFILPFEERSALLQAGRSFTNVARVLHSLRNNSQVGAMLTDRRLDGGGSGSTVGVDGFFRFGQRYSLAAHLVGSLTREPTRPEFDESLPDLAFGGGHTAAFDGERFGGRAASLQLNRSARLWSWELGYNEVSPTYRADTGFQTRSDSRRASAWTGLTFRPNRHGIERISPSVSGGTIWNFDGARKEAWIQPAFGIGLPRQTSISIYGRTGNELFRDVELAGVRRGGIGFNSAYSRNLRFGASFSEGRYVARTLQVPEVGRGRQASASATIRPLQPVVLEPSITFERLRRADGEELYSGYIARTRLSLQANRELNLRLVAQYNDFRQRFDLQPLLVYQRNPFTIFYIGSTYGSSEFDTEGFVGTDRQYFAKFQYLFRR
jgi:hypothetical protein